jgi:DHA2 family multidrug resistance protein
MWGPGEVFTFGALLQTLRLLGTELRAAFIQTSVRLREQTYSSLIGVHVSAGSTLTHLRLQCYIHALPRYSSDDSSVNVGAIAILAHSVQNQTNLLAYIDGFVVLDFAVIGALLPMLLLRNPQPRPKPRL